MLDRIHKRAAALHARGTEDPSPLLDEMALVHRYREEPEPSAPGEADVELANMQRGFDAHVQRSLTQAGAHAVPLALEDIRAALPEDTVLLWLYFGEGPDGRIALHAMLITREGVRRVVSWGLFDDSKDRLILDLDAGRDTPSATPVEATVHMLRVFMTEEPGVRDVAPAAQEHLEYVHDWLGPVPEQLEVLRQTGKRHLCVVPHGPLHFTPIHLVGPPGERLGDRWTISYLPSIALVPRLGYRAKPGLQPAAAVGLGFADGDRGLDPIPDAVEEAAHIAGLAGVAPIVDGDATEAAVLGALDSAMAVHIATHGRQNVAAPAFHSLYVTPAEGSDGRICAYELLSLDLRHVALVTLSACETALGRFDMSDNLRGIPASLFVRGASSVVGTLWPVASEPSRAFFTALYDERAAGKGRFEAFTAAQCTTRERYPQLRDWAGFYYMGDWRGG